MAVESLYVNLWSRWSQPDFVSCQDRLENEHVGNIDQYRVTREVPLPYNFDDTTHEDDEDGDEDAFPHRGWFHRHRENLTNPNPVSVPYDSSHIG